MQKIALMLGIFLWLGAADVNAAPSSISFAGRLSTAAGPVAGSVNITFSIFNTDTGGTSVWKDEIAITAEEGLVAATLGRPTNLLNEAVFNGEARFLEIIVQGETLSPRLLINSVPYALRSSRADSSDKLGTLAPADVLTTTDATVQRRTSTNMTCPAGTYMRTIAQTGQVTCLPAIQCTRVVGANGAGSGSVNCPAGYTVMGGGCVTTNSTVVQDSAPGFTLNSWGCAANGTVHAVAVCCNVSF